MHPSKSSKSAQDCFKDNTIQFSTDKIRQPTNVIISFRAHCGLVPYEILTINLPRFTRSDFNGTIASSVSYGGLFLTPSLLFQAAWIEGLDNTLTPYNSSRILLRVEHYNRITIDDMITVNISIENNLKAYCGFPSWESVTSSESLPDFYISSNNTSGSTPFEFPQIGKGCTEWDNCNGNGRCDFCQERCICNEGHGSPAEIASIGHLFDGKCKQKTCPFGKQIAGLVTYNNISERTAPHDDVECSGAGICDRFHGFCKCFKPFTGGACDRLQCPNNCSGHGQCLSLRQIADLPVAQPLDETNPEYGTPLHPALKTWDSDIIHGCVCDSSWEVGFGGGQRQLSEWFGADCSLRHCPTGDNPMTSLNESNCKGRRQQAGAGRPFLPWLSPLPASHGRGLVGNICQVDCSGRGSCDHSTGVCSCYSPSWGDNCAKLASPYRHSDGSQTRNVNTTQSY